MGCQPVLEAGVLPAGEVGLRSPGEIGVTEHGNHPQQFGGNTAIALLPPVDKLMLGMVFTGEVVGFIKKCHFKGPRARVAARALEDICSGSH